MNIPLGQDEVVLSIQRLRQEFEGLVVRGLRAVDSGQLSTLANIGEEFSRIGADHLAGRIGTLVEAIRNDDRSAAAALLRAQTSLRLFERILTLEVAAASLHAMLPAPEEEPPC
jgi:hypothetical protein